MRLAAAAVVLVLAPLAAACGADRADPPPGSTLERTLRDTDGDGVLESAPGEPLLERTDLAPRGDVRRTLLTLVQLSDAHVTDEESPLRVEALDRLGDPVSSAFRPHEALTVQVLAAMETTVNALAPQAVLVSGDIVDNAQGNELDWALGALAGGVVRPDSGDAGYVGVQEASSPDPFLLRPDIDAPRHPGLLAEAQRPVDAPGLDAPWLPLVSNHDLLVQGLERADRALAAIAVGGRKLTTPSAELVDEVRSGRREPGRIDELLEGERAGAYREVPRDPRRRPLRPEAAIERVAAAAGVRPDDGRLRYTRALVPGVRLVALDTAPRREGAEGRLPPDDVAWLAATLAAHPGDAFLVASPTPLEDTTGGDEALAVLDRAPRVLAVLSGDTHRSRIEPRRSEGGGYWLVRAPSLVDYPQQSRAIRVQELEDGRLALDTWLLDHAGARGADGVQRLAGVARDLAFLDAQGGRPRGWLGERRDRNVRLFGPTRP